MEHRPEAQMESKSGEIKFTRNENQFEDQTLELKWRPSGRSNGRPNARSNLEEMGD